MNKGNDFYWTKLDNVGTMYASITTVNNPNIYRISVKLKEKVNYDILESALQDTLQTIPSFNVKLRRGFFWYYLERNDAHPIIMEDNHFPYTAINNYCNNYFLFSVTYYEKRINVDFSHILTDGTGGLNFLTTLITNYMKIKHPKKVRQNIIVGPELVSPIEMRVDSFLKYASMDLKEMKKLKNNNRKVYFLTGPKVKREKSDVIVGTMSVEQIKKITKAKGVTITAYLTAVLIYAIYQGNYKYSDSKDPIVICIPVDLRHYFPSESMNNFFSTIAISIDPVKNDYTLDDVLDLVSNKLKEELEESVLLKKFRFFASLQKNIILRFIPLLIKDLLLKGAVSLSTGYAATMTLSNTGVVKIKDELKEYIDKIDLITYTDEKMPIKVGVCSVGDALSVTFSLTLIDTEIERRFFTYLSNEGLDIKISTSISDDEGDDK